MLVELEIKSLVETLKVEIENMQYTQRELQIQFNLIKLIVSG